MKKEYKILSIIVLFAFILRILFFDTSYIIWDESIYLMHGKLFFGQMAGYDELFLRPPLVSIIIAPLSVFSFETYQLLSKLLIILLNSFIVVPAYLIGRQLSEKTAIIAAVLMSILPLSILNSRYVMTDHPGAVLALLGFMLFFYGTKNKKDKLLYFGSIFLGLSLMMKFTNLVVIGLIIPLVWILFKQKKIKEIAYSIIIFIASIFPYLIYNLLKYNNPIYTFKNAWHVVVETNPITFDFFRYLFVDTFGFLFLLFFIVGMVIFIKKKIVNAKKQTKIYNGIILFAFIILFVYFTAIAGRGVAKPEGIEWEVERFMIVLVPFAIAFISYGLIKVSELIKNEKLRIPIIAIIIIIGISFITPSIIRAYTPQIEFEDGLRHTTYDMGEYIRNQNMTNFTCLGNCPPIAYYSNTKMNIVYSMNALIKSESSYLVTFETIKNENYILKKQICKQTKCSYLYELI